MPVAFDTLKAAKRLQDEAGFSEKQAGVLVSTLAEGVGENLATKADIEAMHTATQAEFRAVRSEMQARDERMLAELAAIRSEMQARDAAMNAREQRLMLHMGRLIAGGVGVVLASIGIVTAIILAVG